MAYLKSLDRNCEHDGCASTALVEVLAEDFAPIGKFCRKHGSEEMAAQLVIERAKAQSGTKVSPIKDISAR
jgi:hypothetical protein